MSQVQIILTTPLQSNARHGFAELDVFVGQHILLTLEKYFNQTI